LNEIPKNYRILKNCTYLLSLSFFQEIAMKNRDHFPSSSAVFLKDLFTFSTNLCNCLAIPMGCGWAGRWVTASYWQNFNDFQTKLSAFKEERDAVRMSIEKANNQLELLKKTNLYNDAFHIWHDGHFGTINSFRLGDLPSRNVPWDEINAAWGQATLLLYTIAKKLNFKFSTYRLVPMGSNSKVVKLDDQSTYELYGSNDYMLTKLLWYGRYDKAMLAFLHCLKELGDHAENEDKHFRLPYRMDRDKIGEMSIKHNQYNTETWTKALKYMLTNLKWLLAWLARRGDNLPE
jgi:beclin 1